MKALRRGRFHGLGLGACVLIAAIAAVLARFETPRNAIAGYSIDLIVALRATAAPWSGAERSPVIVVGLDARTLRAPDFEDLPRALYGPRWETITRKALDHGAKVVVFDMILGFDVGEGESKLFEAVKDWDKPLQSLLFRERRSGRVVIARTKDFEPSSRFGGVLGPWGGVGLAEVLQDGDGVIRRAPGFLEDENGDSIATISGLARRMMVGPEAPLETVEIAPPFRISDLPSVSVSDVYQCQNAEDLRELFEGRAVFVGGAIAIEDQIETADRFIEAAPRAAPSLAATPCGARPVDGGQPGVFAHAAALDGVLRGWAPEATKIGGALAIQVTFVFALAAALCAYFFSARVGALVAIVALPALFVSGGAYLLSVGTLVAFAAPVMAAPLAFTTSLGVKNWVFDRSRRRLRAQFAKYLSEEVIAEMADAGVEPSLGGASKEVTVMFVDLSGFTAYAETVDAELVMEALNRYLTLISKAVDANGGYVDKFIGDAVMAVWNAPRPIAKHAEAALNAAMEIRREVAAEGERRDPKLSVKIGLETGVAMVGNVGSPERLNHSAIGDVVNLASRLESANGRFKAGVLVGPRTARMAGDAIPLLQLLTIRVKGREGATEIFTPIGAADRAVVDGHMQALFAFEAGDFANAADLWGRIDGEKAPWARELEETARDYAERPPAEWNGALRLTDK